jgi:multiple sugar transport system ATP-binding protein
VLVGGRDVTGFEPGRRDLAMVFQDYALYPHLDARTNIAFPLLARKMPKEEIDELVRRAASALDIEGVLDRKPGELSGGERRRVALARAVVRQPAAFLMDEPLANLDVALRRRVQIEIRELQAQTGVTTIYVTHDQIEAMMLAHKLAVLREGRVEQIGPPLTIYDHPDNTFVARFLGRSPMNLLPADIMGRAGSVAQIGVRPERMRLVPPAEGLLTGKLVAFDEFGDEIVTEVDVSGHRVLVQGARRGIPQHLAEVGLAWDDEHLHRFDTEGKSLR